jgi:Mn2+/Fe2+ NRAMP family transporter
MFTIQAAVTIVTAGLIGNVFQIPLPVTWISAIILFVLFLVLIIGRFQLLDKIIKAVIFILALTAIFATIMAFFKGYHPNPDPINHFNWAKNADIFFLIAFIGWMPAPIDIAAWQSLWTIAKSKQLGYKTKLKTALLDFRIGYIGTTILAICFMSLGASIFYGSDEELSGKSVVFAGQLINMFTQSIGSWSYYIIALAAVTTMFSTTLTCLDAYPRVMKPLTEILFPKLKLIQVWNNYERWIWMLIVGIGAIVLLAFLSSSMKFMVDLATTLSFITAPLLAYLNFRVVTDTHFPIEARPNKWLRFYAKTGIIVLSAFTLFYLIWNIIYSDLNVL